MMNTIPRLVGEQSKEVDPNNPWVGSVHESFKRLANPHHKGSIGVKVYQETLIKLGYSDVEIISSEGDITYRDPVTGIVHKDEVKTASATMKYRKKDSDYTIYHWWNQIRPSQEGWTRITLVAVHPDKYEIYRMDREEYFRNRAIGTAGISPGHVGTDELDEVKLESNTKKNTYSQWNLIYEGN